MMEIIINQIDIEKIKKKFHKSLVNSLELDLEIISNYFEIQSEVYGPIIIILDEEEMPQMLRRFRILEGMIHEELELIYSSVEEEYYRTVYIINEGGFVVYIRKEKK